MMEKTKPFRTSIADSELLDCIQYLLTAGGTHASSSRVFISNVIRAELQKPEYAAHVAEFERRNPGIKIIETEEVKQ